MKKVASILAVALFTVAMFGTAISNINTDYSDFSNAVACDGCSKDDPRRDAA